jgi:hypothetical protein
MNLLLICRNNIKPWMVEYLMSCMHNFGSTYKTSELRWVDTYDCFITCTANTDVVFVQSGPSERLYTALSCANIYILNTEQTTQISTTTPVNFNFAGILTQMRHKDIGCIDYSAVNLRKIRQHVPSLRNSKLWPYLPNPEECCSFEPKSKDVAFIGCLSSRRQLTIDLLRQAGVSVTVITEWGAVRDNHLWQHKVLVNIHFADNYQVFEEIRCNRCLFNQMLIVSEDSLLDEEHPVKEFVFFRPYMELVAQIQFLLQHYDVIHRNLYSNNPAFAHLKQSLHTYANNK